MGVTASTTVAAPDGRQWVVESRPSRVPPWRGSLPETADGSSSFLARLLFTLLIGLVLGLVVWLIELPFSLLFSRRRAVTARTAGKELRWHTHSQHEQAVVTEIVAALARGEEEPSPANAEKG
jgi:hypothetical protein